MVPSVLINKKEVITALETLVKKVQYKHRVLYKDDGISLPGSWRVRFLHVLYK